MMEHPKRCCQKNVVLTDPKQTIKTDVLYYDRLPIRLILIQEEPLTDGKCDVYQVCNLFSGYKMIDLLEM
jgi:hypothetical protein